MSQSPHSADLELDNAPFTAEQRQWLEQFAQRTRASSSTAEEEQRNGEAPNSSATSGLNVGQEKGA